MKPVRLQHTKILGLEYRCETRRTRTIIAFLPELRLTRIGGVFYYIEASLLCFRIIASLIHIPKKLRKNSMYTNLLN
jgi:hypothetical protein